MFQTFDPPETSGSTRERVANLRSLLTKAKLDAVLVPRADEHQGEYVPACAERLRWIAGFSGSAGLAAIGLKKAVLFTDGRYTVQARNEVDGELFEISMLPRPRISEWIADTFRSGSTIGFDPKLHTISEIERLTAALKPHDIKLKATPSNLIDKIWGKTRPAPPAAPISIHPIEFAGQSASDKIGQLQKLLASNGHDAVILTLTDSIAWTFNIRGQDVPHNPVTLAFAIISKTGKAELFIDSHKLGKDVRAELAAFSKISKPDTLQERLATLKASGKRVRLDADTAAYWFLTKLGAKNLVRAQDPTIPLKAIKNATEIEGAKAAHIRDGAAVCNFLAWLEDDSSSGALDEITAVRKLEDFRRDTNRLKEVSFPTISGSGPHGAIVHYRVTTATNRVLQTGELFLIDSGAQYDDGTTDITRTVAIGTPTTEMRQRFTQVLKGHIAIATARFPKGTRGIDLDPFARRALWNAGADYDHGTGHGIGSYLCVHEGPQSISRAGGAVLQPGMLVSNEPGYYKEGAFGIRIENVVLVTELNDVSGGDRQMMAFETLTLAPIDRTLIDTEFLNADERDWIDSYHARVWKTLKDAVNSETRRWLKAATAPL